MRLTWMGFGFTSPRAGHTCGALRFGGMLPLRCSLALVYPRVASLHWPATIDFITTASGRDISVPVSTQQIQNIFITCVQCWTNVDDVGPALYKCYKNVLCLLGNATCHTRGENVVETLNKQMQ